jgi:hypothetical protein
MIAGLSWPEGTKARKDQKSPNSLALREACLALRRAWCVYRMENRVSSNQREGTLHRLIRAIRSGIGLKIFATQCKKGLASFVSVAVAICILQEHTGISTDI